MTHEIMVRAVPLTTEEFAPFGDVLMVGSIGERRFFDAPVESDPRATASPALWTIAMARTGSFPLRIGQMERHPLSAQTFIPLNSFRYLVVVAPNAVGGVPDMSHVRAFVSEPHQAICYRRNVWHHAMTALDRNAEFIVYMPLRRETGNDVLATPDSSITIIGPEL